MAIRKVGVVGCGLMGSGIAQTAAQAGFPVVVREVNDDLLKKGFATMERNLNRLVEKGALNGANRDQALVHLQGTTRIEDLSDCDIVVEAIPEQLPLKRELFAELDHLCPKTVIFASNTSSLSITEISTATARSDRFFGMHFFNPVPVMKLVEVARTIAADSSAYEEAIAFAESLGKIPVRTGDSTGFIVNRLLIPYLLDAIRVLEAGVASIVDIDDSMKLGCGYPMGPLTLLDFVGLDTVYFIAGVMFDEFREHRFAPPSLLKRMVLTGWHGRKSGRGFYDYSDPKNPKPVCLAF